MMSTEQQLQGPRPGPRPGQAGFTLMEVLVALVIFVISVVGLVSMQARSIEAQKAATEIRSAERISQVEMQELMSRGFFDLLAADFEGATAQFPYDDSNVAIAGRMRDQIRNFAADANGDPLGGVEQAFQTFRTVRIVVDPNAVPAVSSPSPLLPLTIAERFESGKSGDLPNIWGLELEVLVMWVDRSNPAYPPPASAKASTLVPANIDPVNAAYKPWVGHVRLRTNRANNILMN